MEAFGGELVGLGQRFDVAALIGENGFDVEAGQREAGKRLAEIRVEESLFAVHGGILTIGVQGGSANYAALHNRNMRHPPIPVKGSEVQSYKNFAMQQNGGKARFSGLAGALGGGAAEAEPGLG